MTKIILKAGTILSVKLYGSRCDLKRTRLHEDITINVTFISNLSRAIDGTYRHNDGSVYNITVCDGNNEKLFWLPNSLWPKK